MEKCGRTILPAVILCLAVFSSCGLSVGKRIHSYNSPMIMKLKEFPAKATLKSDSFIFNLAIDRTKTQDGQFLYNVDIETKYIGNYQFYKIYDGDFAVYFFKDQIVTDKNWFNLKGDLHTKLENNLQIKSKSDIDALTIGYNLQVSD